MAHTKAEWRERLLRARRAIDAEARRRAAGTVVRRLARLPELATASSVLLYVARGAELDIGALTADAACTDKTLYHPAGTAGAPAWIHAEAGSAAAITSDRLAFPVLLIAPGVGFDAHGRRLGRGGGYYDRAIGALRRLGGVLVVGVAYDVQVVDAVPQDPWDERVDVVVTERRVLAPNAIPCRDRSAPRAGGGAR